MLINSNQMPDVGSFIFFNLLFVSSMKSNKDIKLHVN